MFDQVSLMYFSDHIKHILTLILHQTFRNLLKVLPTLIAVQPSRLSRRAYLTFYSSHISYIVVERQY